MKKSEKRNKAISNHYRIKREGYQLQGQRDVHDANMPNLHREGCLLYWAEGSKHRTMVCFTNSDIEMVRLFAKFLIECYDINPNDFRLQLNCYLNNGLSLDKIKQTWKDAVGITDQNYEFQYCKVNKNRGSCGKLKYGICQLRLHNVMVVQRIYGSIQEYWNIKREEWIS